MELSRLEAEGFWPGAPGPLERHAQRADFLFSRGMVADDLKREESGESEPAWLVPRSVLG